MKFTDIDRRKLSADVSQAKRKYAWWPSGARKAIRLSQTEACNSQRARDGTDSDPQVDESKISYKFSHYYLKSKLSFHYTTSRIGPITFPTPEQHEVAHA